MHLDVLCERDCETKDAKREMWRVISTYAMLRVWMCSQLRVDQGGQSKQQTTAVTQ